MFFAGTSRFRLIRLLGTGGMGSVHLVYDEQLETEVALKTLNLTSGADLYRFKREFRTLADIKHPNLVTLYELVSEGPLWFFTMEYVPGLPFDQHLATVASAIRRASRNRTRRACCARFSSSAPASTPCTKPDAFIAISSRAMFS